MANDLKGLIEDVCGKEGWPCSANAGGFRLDIPLPGGRRQGVVAQTFRHEGETLVRLTTFIGHRKNLDLERCAKALELNYSLPYAQLALEGEHLVLTETRPLETAAAETTSALLKFMARQADLYEKTIFGQDRH